MRNTIKYMCAVFRFLFLLYFLFPWPSANLWNLTSGLIYYQVTFCKTFSKICYNVLKWNRKLHSSPQFSATIQWKHFTSPLGLSHCQSEPNTLQTSSSYLQDTFQTLPRHLPDTIQTPSRDTSDIHYTPSRQLPGTFQTTSRHLPDSIREYQTVSGSIRQLVMSPNRRNNPWDGWFRTMEFANFSVSLRFSIVKYWYFFLPIAGKI